MYISTETFEQTENRIKAVLKQAKVKFYETYYRFDEVPINEFPLRFNHEALAVVRDDFIWSQLIPSADLSLQLVGVFRFHFPQNVDNSGFVGWLASHLKKRLGTGVFVICGSNKSDGGIFDYWGCPIAIVDEVFNEIRRLTN